MSVPIELRFEDCVYPIVISDIGQAKVTESALLPDKRVDFDDKSYTPPLMYITCDVGTLLFDAEVIRVRIGISSVMLSLHNYTVEFRQVNL